MSVTARKRGNRWEYRFEGASINGKRKQISKCGFRTKKDAILAGSKAYAEYNRAGLIFEPSEISVSDYLDYWFKNDVMINKKYNTQIIYGGLIRNYYKPALGNYRLSAISPSILIDWLNSLKDKELANSTLKLLRTTLSVALNYAVEPLQYISSNPMKLVRVPKFGKKKKERILITEEQFCKMLKRFPFGHKYYIPLLFGWNLGLRVSEIVGITWDDINFENCTVFINKQMIGKNDSHLGYSNKLKSSVYLESLKTESSIRIIKFGSTLKEALIKEKKRQEQFEDFYKEYYTITTINENSQLKEVMIKDFDQKNNRIRMVCIDENGTFITPASIMYLIRIIKNELKIPITSHSFRHTHATKLLDNGAQIKAVQMRLGHKSLSTTYDNYIHNTSKMENDAINIFESINEKINY